MGHPAKGYWIDGERVPGTTTIIGRFKESGALIRWAWKQGRDGFELYETRDRAAQIGTLGHEMVEKYLDGEEPDTVLTDLDDDAKQKARNAFNAFLNWWLQTRVEVVDQEMQMYSREYRFGGTPDAIGMIGGELCLLDWKTSNGVYSDHLIQLAAYRQLWNENNPDRPLTGGSHLCRFAKEHGDFHHHYFPDLSDAFEQFKLFRKAYDIDKKLRKRV